MTKGLGDRVQTGEALAQIESNESLTTYSVTAPIAGVITARSANEGEQSGTRTLFTIVDLSSVWAELSVFPRDRSRIRVGAKARVKATDSDAAADGRIERIDVLAGANQAVAARVSLKNANNVLVAGTFVVANVAVAQRAVPLAVKTSGLQPFRDFMVVYRAGRRDLRSADAGAGRAAGRMGGGAGRTRSGRDLRDREQLPDQSRHRKVRRARTITEESP